MRWSRILYNEDLSYEMNVIMFWAWESIIHHMYFAVLFVQRQFSETWSLGKEQLWKLNMEKECAFFSQLFGGDPSQCAYASITLFTGLWFDTATPTESAKAWIGRVITNYQHTEASIHFLIILTGFAIVAMLSGKEKADDKGIYTVPGWLRWLFFLALYFETLIMCFPYLALFYWAWDAASSGQPIVQTMQSFGSNNNLYVDGIQMGASLITMLWVSIIVLILDGWATWRAGQFAMGKRPFLEATYIGITIAAFLHYANEFFAKGGRGTNGEVTFAVWTLDGLHALFGDDDTSMIVIAKEQGHVF